MTFLFTSQRHAGHFAEPYLRRLSVVRPGSEGVYRDASKYDVVWCEWGGSYTRGLLRGGDIDGFVMVRVHDAEVRTGTVKLLDWSKVDCVWFINEETQADFNGLVDYPREKQFYLPNAIDLREWPLVAEGDKHIGMITVSPSPRKRLDRARELMLRLPEYHLTIRTNRATFQAPNVSWDIRRFDNRTVTDRREVVDFWRDKSHVICTSEHEAFCYAFAEGMACGAAGTTWDWEWGNASTFYPGLVSGSLEEMAERVETTLPGKWWRRQMERFDADVLTPRLVEILEDRL